ncbi:Hypercellular protein HypA [Taphrina deformans PYCC 5710]|uniref:Hypercellular protein HypA n=1 Tax=Taphrina deformans (strain PYCC 5710 / ATCC 11124 / CBS 356.35 / IMI 108563 / JCM 9778 / NBRC 8474) TaxID=1097556 RepID=R4XHD4_TAPDE|nr:Hypercellular protein HypA [Taphrina deformans PYCC 5710]|eukprot:CCG82822.1 Hypercellular protein HypA [Taphrina deformans PYCC 5710]
MGHARLKVLLAPLTPLKRARFQEFSQLIRQVDNVRLEDVAVNELNDDYNFLNPRSNPNGRVLLDFVSEVDREHTYLESFEYSRQVFAVLLMADGQEHHDEELLQSQIDQIKKTVPTAVSIQIFVFDSNPDTKILWPPDTPQLSTALTPTLQLSALRDALADFTSSLLAKMNGLYINTRERANVTSPYEPASEFIRPQLQRVSSYALADAQITPASSPPPGAERPTRSSLGPGILASIERAKVLSNGRSAKLCGDLLLVCGFGSEALKLYTEAAAIARANNDYLWQGAALEKIGVCLVLLTFLDVSFQIPPIAQSSAGTISYKTSDRKSTSSSKGEVNLVDFLPELYSGVLNLYQKSTTTQNDQIPAFVMAETSLRLANFMASVHIAGGLTRRALENMVLGTERALLGKTFASYPPRAEIAAWAMRAYQGPIQSLSLADRLHVLSGLASVLGSIGFLRRRAFFLREIVLALTPALVQARVAGAAGLGIHPAASLALSENHNNNFSREVLLKTRQTAESLVSLLESVARSYGLPEYSNDADLEEITLGGYGWPYLRNATIKDCISICEAIPDFAGVLRFSARSLAFGAANLAQDEQVKLLANIPRILAAAKRSGITDLEIDYWDSYLIRDISVHVVPDTLPVKRLTRELLAVDQAAVNRAPFLYNPYQKKTSTLQQLSIVQNEPASFIVTLQNPFAFDVEALEIDFITDGPRISCSPSSAYLKAMTTTTTVLKCTAQESGDLKVLGCRVKISGCRPRIFSVREAPSRTDIEDWHVARGGLERVKRTGVAAKTSVTPGTEAKPLNGAATKEVLVKVLPAAPTLLYKPDIKSSMLTINLFEGETTQIQIGLENISEVPITFLTFTFSDSTIKPLEQAINSKTKQPHEIHELETFLYKIKALQYFPAGQASHIEPSSTTSFTIQLYGKRGTASADIIVNYGHLPIPSNPAPPSSETSSIAPSEFYTRQLIISAKVNVHPALSVVHCDILPITTPKTLDSILTSCHAQFASIYSCIPAEDQDDYCLMILDIRNAQHQTMTLHVSFDNETSTFTATEEFSGLAQRRLLIPMRRKYLTEASLKDPVPSLTERQFIVSSVCADVEAANRESFWVRESLLARLAMTWTVAHRKGRVEERSISINRRMIENYLLPTRSVTLRLDCDGAGRDVMRVGRLYSLLLRVHNRAPDASRMMVRVTVAHDSLTDLSMHFIILGTAQYPLTFTTGLVTDTIECVALSSGDYYLQASIAPLDQSDRVTVSQRLKVQVVDE